MRMLLAFALVVAASAARADEVEDAHRLALMGRDSYWNCLAREYSRPDTRGMSAQDFTADLAGACPSERQSFRVSLQNYLSLQFPDSKAASNLDTANHAIELAKKDILKAFIHRKDAPN